MIEEAERAEVGNITAACNSFISMLGSNLSDERLKLVLIKALREDPEARNTESFLKLIANIESKTVIVGGDYPSMMRRTTQEKTPEMNKSKQHCQICPNAYHLAKACWMLCRRPECSKYKWHHKAN